MVKRKESGDKSRIRMLLRGLLVSTVSYFGCLTLATVILYLGDDPTYKSELWSFGAMLVSGCIAGAVNRRLVSEGGVVTAMLSSLSLVLILLLVSFTTSSLPSVPMVTNYLIYLLLSTIAALLSGKRAKRRRH